jgi:hypothetical protein
LLVVRCWFASAWYGAVVELIKMKNQKNDTSLILLFNNKLQRWQTNNQQPTTINQQQTTNNQQLSTNSEQRKNDLT